MHSCSVCSCKQNLAGSIPCLKAAQVGQQWPLRGQVLLGGQVRGPMASDQGWGGITPAAFRSGLTDVSPLGLRPETGKAKRSMGVRGLPLTLPNLPHLQLPSFSPPRSAQVLGA